MSCAGSRAGIGNERQTPIADGAGQPPGHGLGALLIAFAAATDVTSTGVLAAFAVAAAAPALPRPFEPATS